jgi:hypothetical protein
MAERIGQDPAGIPRHSNEIQHADMKVLFSEQAGS